MRAKEFIHEADSRRQRITEIITEVFGSEPPETQWHTQDLGRDSKLTSSSARWKDPTGADVITFFNRNSPSTVDVAFSRDGSVKKTGTGQGKQAQVFGGVLHNINDYLKMNPDVNAITFSAGGDPKRAKLYQKMIDRLAPEMGFEPGKPQPYQHSMRAGKDFYGSGNLLNPNDRTYIASKAVPVSPNQTPARVTKMVNPGGTPMVSKTTYKPEVPPTNPNLFVLQRAKSAPPSGGGGGGGGGLPLTGGGGGGGGGVSTTSNILRQMNPFKLN